MEEPMIIAALAFQFGALAYIVREKLGIQTLLEAVGVAASVAVVWILLCLLLSL